MDQTTQKPPSDYQKPISIILGPSGRGKSTSIRTLDPASTVIFNTEMKPLPFRESSLFKNVYVENVSSLFEYIKGLKDRKDIQVVVIDSFSSFSEQLVDEAMKTRTGYAIWNFYNGRIYELFQELKKLNKFVFLMAHDEILNGEDGETVKRVKVKGKGWEGLIEKEVIIVLYATMKANEDTANEYFFRTQSDGITSAKSPMGMFETKTIPNDLRLVVNTIHEYYTAGRETKSD